MSPFVRYLRAVPVHVRLALFVVALAPMVAVPLNAQITPIAAGQTISGRLDTSDGRLTDDSYFDLYEYRGQAGE
ncbi:MAG: hypothetical protein L7S64_10240 [Longimicrobiales bacterium]|nr:hypothetical protein [Longimicrobiales bacterium]